MQRWSRSVPQGVRTGRSRERGAPGGRKLAGGDWQTAAALSQGGHRSFAADVAISPRGDATAVWLEYTHRRIQAAARPADGDGWQAPEDISARRLMAGGPDVAVDARGSAVVVWSDTSSVQGATRPAGADWQRPAKIADRSEFSDVQVGVDASGGAVAAWQPDEGESAYGASRPAGGRWRDPVEVSPRTDAAEASGAQLALAVAPNGRAVAVFGRARGTAYVALAAAYEPR